ncbi:chromosomal replication initiator protein DnaA [Streptococcus fryi]
MAENIQLFWQRVLELAQEKLAQTAYDFFVADAQLIKIEGQKAYILLDSMKINFWKMNLTEIIFAAGWEYLSTTIEAEYLSELEHFNSEATELVKQEPTLKKVIPINSNLNPNYQFSNFIQGDGNKWAFSAALAVAESPGIAYNPLFIWGGPGLGKTHLLNAIGNSVHKERPEARIKYLTAEEFINEFVTHIRLGTMNELKEKFRTLDVLLIDDVQILANKNLSVTQVEFFNTFNELHGNSKQIVLTSDRPPKQLNDLEERLVSRFSWGLTQDITPPDYETRIAIIQEKIQQYSYTFPIETIEYLAGQFDSNVRELEGALKNISLIANVKKVDIISVDLVNEAIRSINYTKSTISVISIESIQENVAKFYGITVKEIQGTKRVQNIALARQIAVFLSRELTDFSLPKIGKEFGGRDHSTILHAYNKIKDMITTDENLRIEIETIKKKLK